MSIESIMSIVIQRISVLLYEEIKFLTNVEDEVNNLSTELKVMQSYLRDAEARQEKFDHVDYVKVREIAKIAYDAEDVTESFILNHSIFDFLDTTPVCENFRFLRVLHIVNDKSELPEALGNLIFLRYLRISSDKVPRSLGNLHRLLIFDFHCTRWLCDLPNVFTKLEQLRHLCFRLEYGTMASAAPKLKLHTFRNLQSLWGISAKSWRVKDLEQLSHLRKLRVTNIASMEELESVWKCPSITSDHVHKLSLGVDDEMELSSLGPISHSHNLSSLYLWGSLQQLPLDCGELPRNLTKLILEKSKLSQDPMPFLGNNLPYLKHLILGKHAYTGSEMVCKENSFLALEKLEIYLQPNLQSLKVENRALPQLKHLQIPLGLTIPQRLRQVQTLHKSGSQSATGGNKSVSYAEAVKMKNSHKRNTPYNEAAEARVHDRKNEEAAMSVEVKEEEYAWLKKCYVGELLPATRLTSIQDELRAKGFLMCHTRHMGGKLMLLSSDDDEEVKQFVANEVNGLLFKIKIIEELSVFSHHTEELRNDSRIKNVSTPPADLGGGAHLYKDDNRKEHTLKKMPREQTAQDKLSGDSSGLRREISFGLRTEVNRDLVAQVPLVTLSRPRSAVHQEKGQDECCILEAHLAVQKENGPIYLGIESGTSTVPWYPLESQPIPTEPPSPKLSHVSQTPFSSPPSDSRRTHGQTPTTETSVSRTTLNNSDADLEESLAVLTKRLKSKKGNSVRKKKNMDLIQSNIPISSPGEHLRQHQEAGAAARIVDSSPSHYDPLSVAKDIWDFAEQIGVKSISSKEEIVQKIADLERRDERAMFPDIAKESNTLS
ncbi:hypothetical protein Ancab_025432 [Ancistrocladus abbreviatus]